MNKYALITGGTKGIGNAVASILGKSGYNLILTYSSDADAANTVSESMGKQYSINVFTLQADVTDKESVNRIDSFLKKQDILLDTIVMNAGLTLRDSFEEMTLSDWERVFYANVHFPVFLLQRIVGRIKEGGSIVFTGSLMGIHPHGMSLAYGVTKSAVHALVKNLVKFLVPYKIRVNAVAPGFVDTDWQKNKPEKIRQNIENKLSVGRFCKPEEVAEVYKMLIDNQYFNGEVVVIDGGYSYK